MGEITAESWAWKAEVMCTRKAQCTRHVNYETKEDQKEEKIKKNSEKGKGGHESDGGQLPQLPLISLDTCATPGLPWPQCNTLEAGNMYEVPIFAVGLRPFVSVVSIVKQGSILPHV